MIQADDGEIRVGQDFDAVLSFNWFWSTKVLAEWTRFKGVYSQNKLPKKLTKTIKDGSYVVNLHEYMSKETHGIVLCINGDSVTYFDRFGFDHIPEEIKRFICNRNIIKITSEYRPMTQ